MDKGRLVVIEGACDGIGKSTQYNLLYKRLVSDGNEVLKHHFPSYGTYHGEAVERYLRGEYGHPSELSPYFVANLYANDRAITWHTKLRKAYEEGNFILLDRYTTSSLIYQSALIKDINKKKEFIDYVSDLEYNKLGSKEPDNVIFLYAPFDLVTEMRRARKENDGIVNDIHERDLEFMKNVYDSAMFVSEYLSWDMVECNNGNKMRSIDDIHKDVYRLVKKR